MRTSRLPIQLRSTWLALLGTATGIAVLVLRARIPPLGPAPVEVRGLLLLAALLPCTGLLWAGLLEACAARSPRAARRAWLAFAGLYVLPTLLALAGVVWLLSDLPKPVAEARQLLRGDVLGGTHALFAWIVKHLAGG